jgi:hypothetical protein
VCGRRVGAKSEARFCVYETVEGTSSRDKVKAHIATKHLALKPGWYIGKIPQTVWPMLIHQDEPLEANNIGGSGEAP